MGKEARNVQAAAELFNKANDILGYLQNSDMINLFAPISKLKRGEITRAHANIIFNVAMTC
jgi:hypothetical protein